MNPHTEENSKIGFIYVLTNDSFPGLVKIGRTTQSDVENRVRQMSTGVPTSFTIAYEARVRNPAEIEKALHRHFSDFRFTKSREWFNVSIDEVKKMVWKFDSSARYKDNLFLAIPEYLESKEEIEMRNSKLCLSIVLAVILGFFVLMATTSGLISAVMATLPVSFFIYLIVAGTIFPKINTLLYQRELETRKRNISEKYAVEVVDLDRYKENYYQETNTAQIKQYRKMKRQAQNKTDSL